MGQQGRWKNEGGGPTRREKTCKAAAGRGDDPGGCESLETFKLVKAVWLQVMGAHLNTEKASGESWDVLRYREGWETGVERTPPGLPQEVSAAHLWGSLVQATPSGIHGPTILSLGAGRRRNRAFVTS